jgi:hypothetical protein
MRYLACLWSMDFRFLRSNVVIQCALEQNHSFYWTFIMKIPNDNSN